MKHISDFLYESITPVNESGGKIESEKDFREYAEKKFKEVFKDDLDENKMNDVIDGILKKYKDDADKGNWAKLIGVLNKGF